MARDSKSRKLRLDPDASFSEQRRRVLAAIGLGGATALAGCSGGSDGGSDGEDGEDGEDGGDGTPTSSDPSEGSEEREFVDDATLTMHSSTPVNDITWNPFNYRDNYETDFPREVYPLLMDQGGSRGDHGFVPELIDNIDITDTAVTVTFKESGWSNGDPITAKDWGIPDMMSRWSGPSPEAIRNRNVDDLDRDYKPRGWWEAITDITWEGQELTYHSEDGWFELFWMRPAVEEHFSWPGSGQLARHVGWFWRGEGPPWDRDFYGEMKDLGDDAWSTDPEVANQMEGTPEPTPGDQLREDFTSIREEWDPEDPLAIPWSGPFQLDRIQEDRVVLTKNENYRAADLINYPEVEFRVMGEPRVRNTALSQDELDALPGLGDPPSSNQIDSFPDNIEYHRWGAGGMSCVMLNQYEVEHLGNTRVRHALLYAMNKPQLARIEHEYASDKPENPPGLMALQTRELVDDETQEQFESYELNRERATSLLEDEGFTKDGDWWQTPDGNQFTLSLLTSSETAQIEQGVKAQFDDFGIETQIERVGDTIFSDRISQGDFQVAMGPGWATEPLGLFVRAVQQSDRRNRFNLWSKEEVDEFVDKYDNVTNEEYSWTNNIEGWTAEQARDFTLEAPPVGEPDGELQEYPVVSYALMAGENLSEEERQRINREAAWVYNWVLPVLPFATSYNLAFQDHEEWIAPDEDPEWQHFEEAHVGLIRNGVLQANPDAF